MVMSVLLDSVSWTTFRTKKRKIASSNILWDEREKQEQEEGEKEFYPS